MGTNYYLEDESKTCPHCNHNPTPKLHIGKSSAGWCFTLHVIPDLAIHDLEDWLPRLNERGCRIVDEYDEVVPVADLLPIITERSWNGNRYVGTIKQQWQHDNHAEDGPNGLSRHKLQRGWCVKHGAGTWDCVVGEFS